MTAINCTIPAIRLDLISVQLGEHPVIALIVQLVTEGSIQEVNDHRFADRIGVEPILDGDALAYLFRVSPCEYIGIVFHYLVQDGQEVVAFGLDACLVIELDSGMNRALLYIFASCTAFHAPRS